MTNEENNSKKVVRPSGWWQNKEHCIEECKKQKTLSVLKEHSGGCFASIRKNGWKDECYSFLTIGDSAHHGKRPNKRNSGYWNTLENCIYACKKCKNTEELHKKYGGAVNSIRKHGWESICYKYLNVRTRKYTYEQLENIARSFATYKEFREKASGAFYAAKKREILDKICSHMPQPRKTMHYEDKPNYESCKQKAALYTSRSEFRKKDMRYYSWAQRHDVLDHICSHMPRKGNKKKRCVYVAEFPDNCAYIGLTYFAERRWADHLRSNNSAVKKHIDETGLQPTWKKLTDYIDSQDACIKEGEWVEIYDKEGWFILNVAKTGSLGANKGYTLDEILKEVAKYDSLTDFFRGSSGHYQIAYRNNWMDEIRSICKHTWKKGYTPQEVKAIFEQFDNLTDLRKYKHSVIDAAHKFGIFEECIKKFKTKPLPHYHAQRYTIEKLHEIANKFVYRSDFYKYNPSAYNSAKHKGILDKICGHMHKKPRPKKQMTEEDIRLEALKYKSRTDFIRYSNLAAKRARELGIYDDVCMHMRKPHYKYSTEEAIEIAKSYSCRTSLYDSDKAAYNRLLHDGILDEIMPVKGPHNFKWTDEKRREVAALCKTRKEFKKRFPQAMGVTRVKKDWNEIAPHLIPLTKRWTEEEIKEVCSHCSNMKELKTYNYKLWYNCSKHPERRKLAQTFFNKK